MAKLGSTRVYGNLIVDNAINLTGQLTSGVATGTAPLVVASTTLVTNLNAGLLNDMTSSTAAAASTIVARDTNGYIRAVYLNSSRGAENTTAESYLYDSGDGWMRKKTLANTKTEIVTSAAVIAGLGFTPYNATNPAGYVTSSGVTSVATSGSVSGITLTGGPITTTGTITLGGSISGLTTSNLSASAGITNAQLANSSITIGSSAVSLGVTLGTIAGLTSLTSATIVATTSLTTGSAGQTWVVDGSTTSLLFQSGATPTTRMTLTDAGVVTATTFVGALTGNADTATKLGTTTVGSTTLPIYLNAGAPTALTQANLRIGVFGASAIGSTTLPVYIEANGVATALTQANLRIGVFGSSAIGSTTQPIYMAANGVATAMSGALSSTYGGTGINNGGRTLTISTNSGTISYTNASTTLTVAAAASVSGTNTGDSASTPAYAPIGTANASTFTITTSYINGVVDSSYAGAQTITLNSGFTIGAQVTIIRSSSNAGAVTINRSGTETINGATSVNFSGQYKAVTLVKVSSTAWLKIGA